MPLAIIGLGEKPTDEKKPMGRSPMAKKFLGLGGKLSSESPDTEEEETMSEGSDGIEEARMFGEAVKSGNPRRILETFRALSQCCSEMEEE